MNLDNLIALTQDLVRRPSPAGKEEVAIEQAEAAMSALGYDKVWRDGVGNAVGIIEGAQPGPTLLFDGHCDTVGIAPGVPWQDDPFCAKIENNAIYGRGAADMKGAVAAMV